MIKQHAFGMIVLLWISGPVFSNTQAHEHGPSVTLEQAHVNPYDKGSLQRGAAVFMNYCSGCHSLQYTNYTQIARGIGLTDEDGTVMEGMIKKYLDFSGAKLASPIQTSMPPKDAAKWFGIPPPDLTLVSRVRGVDWLYTYLKSFYADPTRPWGVNNRVFSNVAMPHVLEPLQRSLSSEAYDQVVRDLVNFLDYVGEPTKIKRKHLGVWVMLFLTVFTVFAYLLKREYWKDVH